jgi:hypothetical protein
VLQRKYECILRFSCACVLMYGTSYKTRCSMERIHLIYTKNTVFYCIECDKHYVISFVMKLFVYVMAEHQGTRYKKLENTHF